MGPPFTVQDRPLTAAAAGADLTAHNSGQVAVLGQERHTFGVLQKEMR